RCLLELRQRSRPGACPAAFSALGHDLKCPRLEVVKDLLQPRDTLVEPGRCPPAADRLHALPRAEADEAAGLVNMSQQLRSGGQALQDAPVSEILPAPHELVLEPRLH